MSVLHSNSIAPSRASEAAATDSFDVGGTGFELSSFEAGDAAALLDWVKTPEDLHLLAPKTDWPLSVEKVCGWLGSRCQGYCLRMLPGREIVGYGEVNHVVGDVAELWLGHVIVDPARRGCGLGCVLVRALLARAFHARNAKRVALIVFPENVTAVNCYVRSGFRAVGSERHRCGPRGGFETLRRFEITRSEFRDETAPR